MADPLHHRLRPKVYQNLISKNHLNLKDRVISLKDFKRSEDLAEKLVEVTIQDEVTNRKDENGENVFELKFIEFRAGGITSTCRCSLWHNNSIMCRHITVGYERLADIEKHANSWLVYNKYFVSHDVESNLPVSELTLAESPSSPAPSTSSSPDTPLDVSYPINHVESNRYGAYSAFKNFGPAPKFGHFWRFSE